MYEKSSRTIEIHILEVLGRRLLYFGRPLESRVPANQTCEYIETGSAGSWMRLGVVTRRKFPRGSEGLRQDTPGRARIHQDTEGYRGLATIPADTREYAGEYPGIPQNTMIFQ